MDAQYVVVPQLAATLSGRIGGSFFDFNGTGTSGNVEEVLWSTRIGIDWIHEIGPKSVAYAGLGFEYGEEESWLSNLAPGPGGFLQETTVDGPQNILTGGSLRVGVERWVATRLAVAIDLDAGAYRGRTDVVSQVARYHWLGRSVGVSLGLNYTVHRGATAPK